MKFYNIAKFFTIPTLTDVANIYNDNTSIVINDEIQTGYKVSYVNERINCFTLPTLIDVANIYNINDINDEIQTGNIIQDGIIISGVN
jgi:hypothetical protein